MTAPVFEGRSVGTPASLPRTVQTVGHRRVESRPR